MKKKHRNELRGRIAEYMACVWLQLKGYRLIARRFRALGGEIDLVMRRGHMVIFVEVKRRSHYGQAVDSIHARQQRRIAQAARRFIAIHSRYAHHDLRFDAVVITSWLRMYHIQGAWSV